MSELDQHVAAYANRRPVIERAASGVERMLTEWIDADSVNYLTVAARAKTVESFQKKCRKVTDDGSLKYSNPLEQLDDLLAARVITYLPAGVDQVCEIVRSQFKVHEEEDKGAITRAQGRFGYASKHFVVSLNEDRRHLPEYSKFGDLRFEIQVRTAVQHAWAEFEHDVRYKVDIPQDRIAEFDRRFSLAAALIELADNEFTQIDQMFRELATQATAPVERSSAVGRTPLDVPTLTALLSRRHPDAPRSRITQYEWVVSALVRAGIATVEDLDATLLSVDSDEVAAAMDHKLPAGHVRRLDDDLLAALGSEWVTASAGHDSVPDRRGHLQARTRKLGSQGRRRGD